MAITYLMIVIFMAILGIVFLCGKGAMLIAGYNTASPEERAKMDEKQLCRFMGKFCFAMAGGWLIAAVGIWLKQDILHIGGIVLFCVVIIAGLIYANTGNRFKKQS